MVMLVCGCAVAVVSEGGVVGVGVGSRWCVVVVVFNPPLDG